MQPGSSGVELLVGPVADGDHQRRDRADVVERLGVWPSARSRPARRAAATAPGWTRSAGWVPARSPAAPASAVHSAAASWERAEFARAHEQRRLRPAMRSAGREPVEGVRDEVHVAAATVAARPGPVISPTAFEDVEVVGQQVRLDAERAAQLDRRTIRPGELVDDRQPGRVTERGVPVPPERRPKDRTPPAEPHSKSDESM